MATKIIRCDFFTKTFLLLDLSMNPNLTELILTSVYQMGQYTKGLFGEALYQILVSFTSFWKICPKQSRVERR